MSEVYFKLAELHCHATNEDLAKAKAGSQKALEIDDNCAEAHAVYGSLASRTNINGMKARANCIGRFGSIATMHSTIFGTLPCF